jgi:hypothetical protein
MNWVLIVAALCANEPHHYEYGKFISPEWLPRRCQLTVMDCVVKATKMNDSNDWKEKQAILCYAKFKPK